MLGDWKATWSFKDFFLRQHHRIPGRGSWMFVMLSTASCKMNQSLGSEVTDMKFSLAEFFGMFTLLSVTFAALKLLMGSPAAIVGIIIVSVPMHVIVCELVEFMSRSSRRRNRLN